MLIRGCPDHIRKNRTAVAVRFSHLFRNPDDLGERPLTPRKGAMGFLMQNALKYRITVTAPAVAHQYGPVLVWDALREALTDYCGPTQWRTILVQLNLKAEPEPGCTLFAQPNDGWRIAVGQPHD